jgi:2-C-methyl-D-erythritol 4-phosphate cytidylyltransferase
MNASTNTLCVLLLAGGIGSRMQSVVPKQYIKLGDMPIARYSFDIFLSMPEVIEIVVVCSAEHKQYFENHSSDHITVTFAPPGPLRQDSVYSGLTSMRSAAELVCIHDAARPYINTKMIRNVLHAAQETGAAAAAVKVKNTIKQADSNGLVVKTLPREHLWEVQTPQIIKKTLLLDGFAASREKPSIVTDDVSLIELLNQPVQLVEGCYKNIKITTPEDLSFCQSLLMGYKTIATQNSKVVC